MTPGDEFGMQLKAETTPDWDAALAYAQAITDAAGDEDVQQEAADQYLTAGGPDELDVEWLRLSDVARVRELYELALASGTPYASAIVLDSGASAFTTVPNTGADELVESMWRAGVLAAAGFTL